MAIKARIKSNQEVFRSQYSLIKGQVESTCALIQGELLSKFHKANNINSTEKKRRKREAISNFIEKPSSRYLEKPLLKISISLIPDTKQRQATYSKENIDWTRGRFKGKIEKIVIRGGLINEKIYLTPKGNRISIKRGELGILQIIFNTLFYPTP